MYELPTTPQVPLHESEYASALALDGAALTARAELVGGRIQVEIRAAEGGALVACAVIALPRAARLQAREPAPAAAPQALHDPV